MILLDVLLDGCMPLEHIPRHWLFVFALRGLDMFGIPL